MGNSKLDRQHHPKHHMDQKTRKVIEETAYYRWLNRDADHGLEVDDWLEAEEEVMRNVFVRDPEE